MRIAKNAGMKYIVITTKHHDGFCLCDTKVSDYDIMDATPFKRDILKELAADAASKQGMKLCFYHSIMDWHHPDARPRVDPNYNDTNKSNPNFDRYVRLHEAAARRSCVTSYGPGRALVRRRVGQRVDRAEGPGPLRLRPRPASRTIIINNRVGKGRKGMEGLSKSDESTRATSARPSSRSRPPAFPAWTGKPA